MNTSKTSNYTKIIAFFLVASILLCTFGFAAEGWQSTGDNKATDEEIKEENPPEVNDDMGTSDNIQTPEPEPPLHLDPLTGLEVSPTTAASRPLAFFIDSDSPVYGLSYSDVLIEFPLENGKTRYLSLTSNYRMPGKIGSIAPSRGFMTNLAKYFGAIPVFAGTDDTVEYFSHDHSSYSFDISAVSGYHYTEYSHLKYTNGALIDAGIKNSGIHSIVSSDTLLPYDHLPLGQVPEKTEITGKYIRIPLTKDSETELTYSEQLSKYVLSKNGEERVDLLTDSPISFDNCFILFSDSMTYESASGTELIMDTVSSGVGYYMYGGTIFRIIWDAKDGVLSLFNENGERLSVARGSSYFSFVKSSMINAVNIS